MSCIFPGNWRSDRIPVGTEAKTREAGKHIKGFREQVVNVFRRKKRGIGIGNQVRKVGEAILRRS